MISLREETSPPIFRPCQTGQLRSGTAPPLLDRGRREEATCGTANGMTLISKERNGMSRPPECECARHCALEFADHPRSEMSYVVVS